MHHHTGSNVKHNFVVHNIFNIILPYKCLYLQEDLVASQSFQFFKQTICHLRKQSVQ